MSYPAIPTQERSLPRALGDRASSIDDRKPELSNIVKKNTSKQSLLLPDLSRQGAKESDILANASIISRSDDASQELMPRRDRDSSLQDRSSMVKPIEQPKINILASAR